MGQAFVFVLFMIKDDIALQTTALRNAAKATMSVVNGATQILITRIHVIFLLMFESLGFK